MKYFNIFFRLIFLPSILNACQTNTNRATDVSIKQIDFFKISRNEINNYSNSNLTLQYYLETYR